MTAVPYFSQWESRELVSDFLAGHLPYTDDPLWHLSGATDREEYARWCSHICGMACLKMLLAHRQNRYIPTIELMKECKDYGGYEVSEDGTIKGLIYRPFITYIAERFGVHAEVKEHTTTWEMYELLGDGHSFIASVHPTIRTPQVTPPKQGGHLVYVFARNDERKEVIFHNPSGHTPASQEHVHLGIETFARFYAQRGILIKAVGNE